MMGGAIVAFVSVLVAGLVALCSGGVIRRNALVGIRVGALLASDSAWRRGHRRALVPVVAAAMLCTSIAVVAAVVGWEEPVPSLLAAGVLVAGLVVGAVRGSR